MSDQTYKLTRQEVANLLEDAISLAFKCDFEHSDDPVRDAVDLTMQALDTDCNCVTDFQHCPACDQAARIASRSTYLKAVADDTAKVEW